MTRLNNSHVCICCGRRSDGLAVGAPGRLAWYCNACGVDLAKKAYSMGQNNLDSLEQRICLKVSEQAGQEPITLAPEELPAFIAWAVKEFAETMRKDLDEGGPPF